MDLLVDLIDRTARRMIVGADFTQLLQWCAIVPRDRLRTRLDACLCAAWAQVSFGRMDEFERMLADIVQHPASGKPELLMEVELMKAYRCMRQDDTASQLKIVEPMMRGPATNNAFQLLLMCYIAGIGLVYANRFEAARDVVRWRYRHVRSGQVDHAKPFLEMIEGFSHLIQGHIRLAADLLISVVESARNPVSFGADATGIIVGYLIEAHYQLNELDAARHLLDQNLELIDAVGAADSVLFSYRVRARIEEIDGDTAAALRTLHRLEEFGYREGLDRLVAWSLYEQVRIAIRSHRSVSTHELVEQLEHIADRYRQSRDCVWCEIPLVALLARAERSFAESNDASCIALIDTAVAESKAAGRQVLATRLGLMRAIVLLRARNTATG